MSIFRTHKFSTPVAVFIGVMLTVVLFLAGSPRANAAIIPPILLGTANSFAVLAGTTVINTGASSITGDVGVSPGLAVVGFPPGQVIAPSAIFAGAPVNGPKQDLVTAFDQGYAAAIDPSATEILPELGTQTLIPGAYYGTAHGPLQITGSLILDGQNNPNAVWVFQTDSTLTTAPSSTVSFVNGGSACSVFWVVGSSATIDTGTVFVGTVMALTAITVNNSASIQGRLLARNAAVTLNLNTVTVDGACTSPTTFDRSSGTSTTAANDAAAAARAAAVAAAATAAARQLAATGAPRDVLPWVASSLGLLLGTLLVIKARSRRRVAHRR